jgi:DNA repair exonuclease SbcCD ATPase subunit
MNVIQEERVSVQPTVNLHGQVNLAQIRAGYLKKMQEAILLLGSRYKAIIKKIKAEKSNGSDEKVRQALIKLRERVKLIKSKLQGVKKQYDAAKAQVKKEKAETRAIRANIKKVKTDAAKIISDLRAEIRKLRDAVKKAADRSDLLKTIAKLKTDIKAVHESVKSQLEKHRKELSEKLRALHAQWTKKRQELEDAWKRKKSAMEKAWGRERQKYRDQIRDLKKRNGKCGASEIYNIRLKRCVKLYQNRAPKRPNTVRPSQRLGQFTDQLKQTKDVVNKMNTAIKKMAEMERN